MLRVLMVLEDYGELVFLQTILKKIGFDVDAIQNPRSFADTLLAMNPEVLVMTASGKRVKGIELKKSVKRVRGIPHIILLGTPELGQASSPDEAWLPSPVPILELLNTIGELCGVDKEMLREKFQKLRFKEGELPPGRELHPVQEGDSHVFGASGGAEAPAAGTPNVASRTAQPSVTGSARLQPSAMAAAEREDRFKKFLSQSLPEQKVFELKQVQEQIKSLRTEKAKVDTDLESERRAFVAHLFKKSGDPT